jgi:hypothetical protein
MGFLEPPAFEGAGLVTGACSVFSKLVDKRFDVRGVVGAGGVGSAFDGVLVPRLLGDMASVVFVESAKGVFVESAKGVMIVEDEVGCPRE